MSKDGPRAPGILGRSGFPVLSPSDAAASLTGVFADLGSEILESDTVFAFKNFIDAWKHCVTSIALMKTMLDALMKKDFARYFQAAMKCEVDCLCAALPDSAVVDLSKFGLMVVSEKIDGLAVQSLEHFLHGNGARFDIDLGKVIDTDKGFRQALEDGMFEDMRKLGLKPPRPPITTSIGHTVTTINQVHYSVPDFKLAFGNVDNVFYEVLPHRDRDDQGRPIAPSAFQVNFTLRDPYQWHPAEPRLSQCVHRAIENQKRAGAREYFHFGKTTRFVSFPADLAI